MILQNAMYHRVKEFHKAFGEKMPSKPTPIDKETALKRAVWSVEELTEFLYATVGGDKIQFAELTQKLLEGLIESFQEIYKNAPVIDDVLTAQMDALTDEMYFNQGSFTLAGVEPYNLFEIVQQANMGKLWEDGKPRFRESDGKIIKPPHWEENFAPEPRLKEEIERQKRERS